MFSAEEIVAKISALVGPDFDHSRTQILLDDLASIELDSTNHMVELTQSQGRFQADLVILGKVALRYYQITQTGITTTVIPYRKLNSIILQDNEQITMLILQGNGILRTSDPSTAILYRNLFKNLLREVQELH